ncbi:MULTISPECIES: HD-GYP domain-containing protein [Methylomonas]|uniref:HD-GYP domain-containing protein n=1 Tax=Methylomonas TaxID=416 RepID=UPI001231D31B|nr:HD-GYP domain-containing protein [Methylomonas rhizoryzae]
MSERDETRIHVNELRIGMRVTGFETLDKRSPFLLDVVDIRTQADIQAIQKVCDYVFIDVKLQKKQHGYIPTRATDAKTQLSFARAFDQTATTFQQTGSLIKTVLDDIRFGNPFSVEQVKAAVENTVNAVLAQSDAMLLLTQLKQEDEYTAQHSMNVCVMAILLGRELGLPIAELRDLGVCGLMHDVGKMKVPLHILNKPGRLDEQELVIMRNHPVLGRNILMSARNLYPGAVDVAYCHHERLAGGGYPRGLEGATLSKYTRIVTVVDTYDAVTSDRIYKKGIPHLKALGILVDGMKKEYDSSYVTEFINCIGFYPQGNLAELSSGEVALVVEQNRNDRLKPKLLILLNERLEPCERKILDLAAKPLDQRGQPYRIKQIVRAQEHGIDLIALQQQGVFTQSYPSI